MDFGVSIFPTDLAMPIHELAREAEARGFESLFVPEHTHIPVGRKTPYPAGGVLPEEYRRTLDPFVALAAAAATTTTLKVATGICLVAQRDPIVLAKEVASLDHLSGGRFIFGVGFGWNEDEMEDHGVDPSRRRGLVREKVLAMKALWTQDEGSYDGRYVHVPPSWSWPKPVQSPHPPILVGGTRSATVFKHVVEWADGWMPIGGGLGGAVELRRAFEEEGRDPAQLNVTIFGARRSKEDLERYVQAGVSRVVFGLPPASRDVVLPALDRRAELLQEE